MKNCSLWEWPMLEKFVEDCLPGEEVHARAGDECEEEGVAEKRELTATSISRLPACLKGEELEKQGVTLSPGGREGW